MSTHVLDRLGFAPFDPNSVPAHVADLIVRARERATTIVVPLTRKRQMVESDEALSPRGKDLALTQALNSARVDLTATYDEARQAAERARLDANGKIGQRLFSDIDKPGALAQAHAELLALATRGDIKPSALASDGRGGVLLTTGSAVHRLIEQAIAEAPLASARLAALAVMRASPFLGTLLGGEPVAAAALRLIETRVGAEDPAVATLITERDAAVTAEQVIRGDEATSHAAAHKAALGRPPVRTARAAS